MAKDFRIFYAAAALGDNPRAVLFGSSAANKFEQGGVVHAKVFHGAESRSGQG